MGPNSHNRTIVQRIRKAQSNLSAVYGADRHGLKRKINRLRRLSGPQRQAVIDDHLNRLEREISASIKQRTFRRCHHPAPLYPKIDLPILSKKEEIVAAIQAHQVLIISGETGSGKTTQIPKFCLEANRGLDGTIGCTQPRRIAATTVARRIAEEMGQPLGEAVGYKIRFRDNTSPGGFIKIMTDGILLAELQADPYLNRYDTLIVDEAHERSLNIDLTLGIVKQLLSRRQNLKLIVTSATIDTEKFSRAFNNAPVIEVSGRMYPVQVHYEGSAAMADSMDSSPVELAVEAVGRLERKSRFGDILIFMPTEQDIRDSCRLLEDRCEAHTTIFPLFARLAGPEQSRIFANTSGRKIIVATNVAETSITIPGIKYVIDTGLARIPRYTPRSRCTLLPIEAVSRSSADQRKGRCGRVADGVCVRLYSEEDYLSRPLFTPPEILRANLAHVILKMIALKLGDVADFPFIDPPPPKSVQDGYHLLLELGAIVIPNCKTKKDRYRYCLTGHGKMMARLPIDPRLARMFIEARRGGCIAEVTIIAAALSIQDPRERPLEMQKEADGIHGAWDDPGSDFVTLLNIWRWYQQELTSGKGVRKIKRTCRDHFLSYRRMREWKDIHHQLCIVLKESGIQMGSLPEAKVYACEPEGKNSPRYAALHQSILSGFLSNIACKKEKNIYSAAKGREVMIFPGSGLFNRAGKWMVAAEMVLTSRLFARTVARIDPEWLEPLAKERCRYTYMDPHWNRQKETVTATEQVSLFGLVIVPRRSVVFGRIDAHKAGEIFIEKALVEADLKQPFPFIRHNLSLVDEVLDMENRLRRRDLFIGPEVLADFYHRRLDGVWNVRLLKQKIKAAGDDRFLRIKKDDLFRYRPSESELAGFPDKIRLGENAYPCTYTYNPGDSADGVTVTIPAGEATTVSIGALDWLVPGLINEKIKILIRGLAKTYRRQLGPLPQVVAVIENKLPKGQEPLVNVLGAFLHQRFGVHIPAPNWPLDALPDYLRFRIVVTDATGQEIKTSRHPAILQRPTSMDSDPKIFNSVKKRWERSDITKWDFNDIPQSVELSLTDKVGTDKRGVNHLVAAKESGGDARWVAYPGLTAEAQAPGKISLRLYHDDDRATQVHLQGVRALAGLYLKKEFKYLKKLLKLKGKPASKTSYFGGATKVEGQILEKITTTLFAKNIRSEKAFFASLDEGRSQLHDIGEDHLAAVGPILNAYHDTRMQLAKWRSRYVTNQSIHGFINRRLSDLDRLIPINFVTLYDRDRWDHLPYYIDTLFIRTQRGLVDLQKDRGKAEKIRSFAEVLDHFLGTLSPATSRAKRQAVESFFWMLEAYKVSVFAQELKIPRPVSAKRLDEKRLEIERLV